MVGIAAVRTGRVVARRIVGGGVGLGTFLAVCRLVFEEIKRGPGAIYLELESRVESLEQALHRDIHDLTGHKNPGMLMDPYSDPVVRLTTLCNTTSAAPVLSHRPRGHCALLIGLAASTDMNDDPSHRLSFRADATHSQWPPARSVDNSGLHATRDGTWSHSVTEMQAIMDAV